jgi:hypothetical protein
MMGGFIIRCNRLSTGGFELDFFGKHYCTLTPDVLARQRHFLKVQTRTVQDKSKADILAKVLASRNTRLTLLPPRLTKAS